MVLRKENNETDNDSNSFADGYDGESIGIQSGSINNEESVWAKESSGLWDEEW